MRKFACVLFVCIAFCANARVLHVGDNTIKLSQTKTTDPALHVRVGDELWYGNMVRCALPMNENTDKELKVRYNNTDYWVSEVGDYVIEDGKLIAANEHIYLESTGTQWIDTLHIPTLLTRTEMELKFSDDEYKENGPEAFLGIWDVAANSAYSLNFGAGTSQEFTIFAWICRWAHDGSGAPSWCGARAISINKELKTTKQLLILDAKNNFIQYGSKVKNTLQSRQTTESHTIILFGRRTIHGNRTETIQTYSRNNSMYIYSTKIYENDTLVRHFVPVPCGLQIGDFVVPSNGMWDIVEQKFYGNMGSGDFIYGVDE